MPTASCGSYSRAALPRKIPDQAEDHAPSDVADDAAAQGPRADGAVHLVLGQAFAELLGDPAVDVVDPVGEEPGRDGQHDPATRRPLEHPRRLLLLVAAVATRRAGGHERIRHGGRRRVEDADAERPSPLGEALGVGALVPAIEDRLREAPQRVAGEADGERDQRGLAPRLGGELPQDSLPVGRLAALPERDLQGEDADEGVADALGDEPEPAGVLDRVAVGDALAGPFRGAGGCRHR